MEPWPIARIDEWYRQRPWIVGFNYLPRSAVNWTEQWQAESFDLARIEEELGWAEQIGFNALRTNLQFLVWQHDAAGLRTRLDRFLGAAARRGMRTLLCLFDDCAFSGREPYLGPQDAPVPGVHNSGGAASPGRERVRDHQTWTELEGYTRDLVSHFRDDDRLLGWDLYNEPGNEMVFTRATKPHPDGPLAPRSLALAEASFSWARAERPSQPLTTGVWSPRWQGAEMRLVELSDFVSFHEYLPLEPLAAKVAGLRATQRPLICTEWLARGVGSRVETHLPYFEQERIGCFHWGLVKGRTQTHLPWPGLEALARGGVWHHDLLHADGSAYDAQEIELFRAACARARAASPTSAGKLPRRTPGDR